MSSRLLPATVASVLRILVVRPELSADHPDPVRRRRDPLVELIDEAHDVRDALFSERRRLDERPGLHHEVHDAAAGSPGCSAAAAVGRAEPVDVDQIVRRTGGHDVRSAVLELPQVRDFDAPLARDRRVDLRREAAVRACRQLMTLFAGTLAEVGRVEVLDLTLGNRALVDLGREAVRRVLEEVPEETAAILVEFPSRVLHRVGRCLQRLQERDEVPHVLVRGNGIGGTRSIRSPEEPLERSLELLQRSAPPRQ